MEERIKKYEKALHLIGSIFFYGNFKAETYNERELEKLLRELGFFYEREYQVVAGTDRYQPETFSETNEK